MYLGGTFFYVSESKGSHMRDKNLFYKINTSLKSKIYFLFQLLEKLKLDILSLIPSNEASGYSAPSYVAPTTPPVAVYTEPEYYHPPASQSGSNYPKQGSTQREPLLNKFVKDFGIVNRWLARQTLEIVNDGQSLQLPFEIPEIPTVQKIKKRKDSVMKYIQAPDLSNVKNGSASS